MQIQEFNIEIKNEKIKTYRVITLLIVILNVLFFMSSLFDPVLKRSAIISLGFIFTYTGFRFYISKRNSQAFFFDEWIYFLLMLLWVNNYLIAITCLVLFLLYTISVQKIIFTFDTSLIRQKNFPWVKHEWNALSNVILKDNLLTIDFKNNKLMQAEIINEDIDERAFNAFARKQLGNLSVGK